MTGVLRVARDVLFGVGAVSATAEAVASLGRRVLICTDEFFVSRQEFQSVVADLSAAGCAAAVFAAGRPDVPVATVLAAAQAARAADCDVVVGFGGGSSIDLAKAAALVAVHGEDVARFFGEGQVPGPVLPIVAVPTTAGTGSEVSPVAVVTQEAVKLKVGISSPHLLPTFAIVDPALALSCPPTVTAHAGIDALAHAVESYVARSGRFTAAEALQRGFVGKNELTDPLALHAVTLISRSLAAAYAAGDHLQARQDMALGSLYAGMAFSTAGTTLAHALQYPLGAKTGTPHGLGVGLLLPHVLRTMRPARTAELSDIAVAMGIGAEPDAGPAAAEAAIDAIDALLDTVGFPSGLADLGLRAGDLPPIAAEALGIRRLIDNNPLPVTEATLLDILRQALRGRSSR
ncbi:MAG TPA: iron-containing alcohol dehydrogenase [Trebonia sp.]|jgi:alcohol dehydrogenase|nr:iron-containing alcohol dehydrogenase [Trebonia sp.]